MISAKEFHEKTKHSPVNIRKSTWRMDFDNKPFPFKIYEDEKSISLSKSFGLPNYNALNSMRNIKNISESTGITLTTLTSILFFTGGISRKLHGHFMRTASATGALYPIELYVVVQDFGDLDDGLYHFSVGDFSLSQLRKGKFLSFIAEKTSDPETILKCSVLILMSSYAWKNSWKYQERSYRHWYWDGGVMIGNLLATATSLCLETKVITAFLDVELNKFVGLQEQQEAMIALLPLFTSSNQSKTLRSEAEKLDPILIKASRVSPKEYQFPLIWDIHKKTSFSIIEELKQWNRNAQEYKKFMKVPTENEIHFEIPHNSVLDIEKTILQRGSTERFTSEPLPKEKLLAILQASNSGINLDLFPDVHSTIIECYMNVHAVKDLIPGAYYYNVTEQKLELLKKGLLRQKTGFLCLEQDVFGTCQVVVFLVANISNLIDRLGDRAYRVTQLEAGIIMGKIYLSAFAVQLGARGTTFFDDEVILHFSPHANGKDVMMAIGIGIPAYRAKPGKKLAQLFTRNQLLDELHNYLKQ